MSLPPHSSRPTSVHRYSSQVNSDIPDTVSKHSRLLHDHKISEKKPKKSFFERAKKLIIWLLGGKTTSLASVRVEELQSEHEAQRVAQEERTRHIQELKKYTKEEVLLRAEHALNRLEHTKLALIEEFGDAGLGFIFRHIDPVLASSRKLLDSLGQLQGRIHKDAHLTQSGEISKHISQQENTISDLLEGAIDAVELYAIINDEEHLKRRIVAHIRSHVQQAIQKDVQILMSYYAATFDEVSQTESHAVYELMKFVEKEIDPVLDRLESLTLSFPDTIELRSVFSWRRDFDFMRHGLVAFATLLIDIHISRFCFFSWYYEGRRIKEHAFLAEDTYGYITDSQIHDSEKLLQHMISAEGFFLHLKNYTDTIQDPLILSQFTGVIIAFQNLLEAIFEEGVIFNACDINRNIEKIEALKANASSLIYKDEPPVF